MHHNLGYLYSIETKHRYGRRNYQPCWTGSPTASLTLMGFVPAEMRGTKAKLVLGWRELQFTEATRR